jgi:predicted permease
VADAPTSEEVARILTYVAPGFFARVGYTARFPQREQQHFYALVVSVAASVPLVAMGNAIANAIGIDHDPTDAAYIALLLAPAIVVGYLAAAVRGSERTRRFLRRLSIPFEPEATIYEQTLLKLPYDAQVTILFKDGRTLAGYPAKGPGIGDDEPRELYITSARWWDSKGNKWEGQAPGAIVNLEEVVSILMSADPTHPTDGAEQKDLATSTGDTNDDPAPATVWADADEIRRLDAAAGVLLQTGVAALVAATTIALTTHPHFAIQIALFAGGAVAGVGSVFAGATLRHIPSAGGIAEARRNREKQVKICLYMVLGAIYLTPLVVVFLVATLNKPA